MTIDLFRQITFLAILTTACGPPPATPDCVAVDERLGEPIERRWCDGEYLPTLEWNQRSAEGLANVCLPPEPDGECKLCTVEEVESRIDVRLNELLTEQKPECALEHWELGCMRTVENAKMMGYVDDYCCFQVALWGNACEPDDGSIP
ncbi:hypothetical protein ACNOYE_13395 [Nannocystaceae bacterium ST9]